jgi:DNA-binding IclR family transcriptional regulator
MLPMKTALGEKKGKILRWLVQRVGGDMTCSISLGDLSAACALPLGEARSLVNALKREGYLKDDLRARDGIMLTPQGFARGSQKH